MAKMKNKAPFVYGLHNKYVKSYSDLVKPLGRKQKKKTFLNRPIWSGRYGYVTAAVCKLCGDKMKEIQQKAISAWGHFVPF